MIDRRLDDNRKNECICCFVAVGEIIGSGSVYLVTGFPREVCSKKNGEM